MRNRSRCIRVAIIGAGEIVKRRHLPELSANTKVELVAIAGYRYETTEKVAKMYNIPRIFSGKDGWKNLLAMELDAVYIATPNQFHAEMAMAMLQRDVHVFLEKPMATTMADANALVEEARQRGLILAVGQQRRGMPVYQECKRLIHSNEIGPIRSYRMMIGHNLRRLWNSANWLTQDERTGGILFDIGIHTADMILWLSGKEPTQIRAKLAKGGSFQTAESAWCLISLGEMQNASFEVSWVIEPPTKYLYVFGETGSIFIDESIGLGGRLMIRSPEKEFVWTPPEPKLNRAGYPDWGLTEAFIQAILKLQPTPLCTGEEGLKSVAVITAALDDALAKCGQQ